MSDSRQETSADRSLEKRIEELQKRASKDELSGLLNRSTAEQYITARLDELQKDEMCALFIIDLDDFKMVNDTLGHIAGDQAIKKSAQILSALFRAKDIVGRLGGDEFIAFMSGSITEQEVRARAASICKELQLMLGEEPSVDLTASVGVYLTGGVGHRFSSLYQSADLALYKAKNGGKHSYCLKKGHDTAPQTESFHPVSAIPLTQLMEYMDGGVALLEMSEPIDIIYVSPSFRRSLGVDPRTYVLPKRLSELVHPDDRIELEQMLRKGVRDGEPVEYTNRVSGDGTSWAWWQLRAVRVNYNDPYPVMLVTTTDISGYKNNERRLEEMNQRLRIALDQTTERMWEVDLETRHFSMYDQQGDQISDTGEGNRFPDSLIEAGLIHPSSQARFREFAEKLLGGHVQGFGNFIIQNVTTGCYGWATLSYRMAFDELGRASRAIGIMEGLPPNFVANEVVSVLRRPLPEALLPDLIAGLRTNLSQDTVVELWIEGRDRSRNLVDTSCSGCLARARAAIFNEKERESYASYFSVEELLGRFQEGDRWLWIDYQRIEGSGDVRWVRHIANLVEDPLTREVYLFLYICNLDVKKYQWENAVKDVPLRDSVTHLYTRQAVRDIAEAMLRQGGTEEIAVAVVDIGGLSRLYEQDAQALNRGRYYLAAAFTVALGTSRILARYSTDQLLVIFPKAAPQHELREQLESAFSFVRLVLSDSMDIQSMRFAAGVVSASAQIANISAMAIQASNLCQLWQRASSDVVAFPHENDDWSWTNLHKDIEEDKVDIYGSSEMKRPLSQSEKDVAFDCMSIMLSADSLENSLYGVLSYIGDYYRADRVYILTLAPNGRVVTMACEWTDGRKHSIQQTVSGAVINKFPLLERCIKEKAPVFLTRETPISLQGEPPVADTWHFTAFPLMEREDITGFLCIENAREHPADAAVFSTLIPYILKEQERYGSRTTNTISSSGKTLDIPDLRSYMKAIAELDSDRYSSMGAVCVDIPDMSVINGSLGFEYGSRMLWYVSKTLTDIFGPGSIYHTWDAEFVALCPNTTRQVFDGRCLRLRSLLKRRYPREISMGFSWSDGRFQARDLVKEAKELMQGDPRSGFRSGVGSTHEAIEPAAQSDRFRIYLQPKVDMRSGELYGAEVLVRGVDDHGSLILPGEFIPELERDGGIRELDLFVLDQALAQQEQWVRDGFGVIPISVNLSRVTLLGPTALASVLAIQSRYPLVPAEALELEMTESVGSETGSLQEVVDQFRQCGIKLGLDDFGSKYANLSLFTNVHFDTIKLDRTLISDIIRNPINRMLVSDIVRICGTNGSVCIAEGVEKKAQAEALMEAGCRYAQGFYYDRPMPGDMFEQKYLRGRTQVVERNDQEDHR